MVLILGAGLAGLSAAYHLDDRDVVLVEREGEVGGLCRSRRHDGFVFDFTGHLLHLRDPTIRDWALELLPDGYRHLDRSAWIHSHDVLTPYPFQANTAGLPLEVRMDCLLGFIQAMALRTAQKPPIPSAVPLINGLPFMAVCPPSEAGEPSFLDWILATFGEGFAKHFFVPYNEKLWRRKLSDVTGDWVGWSIPRPELADVLRGAITRTDKVYGYNPQFLYPAAGGIDHLPRSIAARIADDVVRLQCEVVELSAADRRITLANGETLSGEYVLSSLPLTTLARITTDIPADLRAAAAELDHVSIRAVNLGVSGEPVHPDAQWVYFPEPGFPFHRIGLPTALTPAMAPAGHHSLVAEISFRPDADPGADASLDQAIAGLLSAGFLRDRNDVVVSSVVDIPLAYVVFDKRRREVLPGLMRWFVERGIVPMGRYGTWDYLAMEDSLRHGREVARWIAGQAG
jgi:protoporphyrinogen oxidase